MKKDKNILFKIGLPIICIFLVIYYWQNIITAMSKFITVANPLIVGAMIAYILNIIMKFYEKKLFSKTKNKNILKYKRGISILLSMTSIVVILILIARLIIPELKSCVEILVSGIPKFSNHIFDLINKNPHMQNLLPENTSAFNIDMINWKEVIDNLFRWFTSGAGTVIGYVTSFFSGIFNFVVGLIFAIYILGGKEKLANQFKRIVSTYTNGKISTKVFYVLKVTDECFHNFIVGQCIEAVILGALCTIGMLILRLPYAVMIGVFVGCTALIPIAGAYIGAIVGVIMIFTVSPVKSIFFIVFIIILQQLENQLIYPKVVGSSIGLPGIWVFAAVMIGGGLFGIQGVIFGIPIVSVFYQLIKNDLNKREKNNILKKVQV